MTDGTTTIRNDAAGERRLDRRTVLGGAAGAAAAGLAAHLGTPAPAKAQGAPATFVLIPGAWTGAFVWNEVVPLLRAAGHDIYTTTCTGLDTHVTDVVNFLEFADLRDVILVGHSYGGTIITGVAEQVPERLAQLVYLDADVPTDGQNVYDFWSASEEAREVALAAEGAASLAGGMPGMLPIDLYEEWLRGAITDPAVADWFLAKLVPHPLATWTQPIRLGNPAAAALPRVFILCTADKDLEADPQTDAYVLTAERVRTDPNWRVVELADTHMVNLNDPQATAEALLSLA